MSRIVHFEIPAENVDTIIDFYSQTFGWKFNKWGEQPYWIIETGSKDEPGIDGGLMPRRDPAQPMVNTLNVEDVDAAAAKVEENGGQIVVPKTPIPTIGWLVYFKDPEGNIFGMMQNDPEAK